MRILIYRGYVDVWNICSGRECGGDEYRRAARGYRTSKGIRRESNEVFDG